MSKSIDELRDEILQIDTQLIELIAKRQSVAQQIGSYKKIHNLPVFDKNRETLLKDFHEQLSLKNNIAPVAIDKVFDILINESRKVQQ